MEVAFLSQIIYTIQLYLVVSSRRPSGPYYSAHKVGNILGRRRGIPSGGKKIDAA
jgi:hypothetical protein